MKKKTSATWFKSHPIAVLIAVGMIIFMACFFVFYLTFAADYFEANYHINQMRFWDLPPESEFVSFETRMFGGSSTFLEGRLTISSHRTIWEIQEFYETKYMVSCLQTEDVITLASLSNGYTRYSICHVIQVDGA